MPKITLDKLAQLTQEQFSHVDEQLSSLKSDVSSLKSDVSSLTADVGSLKGDMRLLKAGQERILEILLEVPPKPAFERFQVRTETRLTALEKKVGI